MAANRPAATISVRDDPVPKSYLSGRARASMFPPFDFGKEPIMARLVHRVVSVCGSLGHGFPAEAPDARSPEASRPAPVTMCHGNLRRRRHDRRTRGAAWCWRCLRSRRCRSREPMRKRPRAVCARLGDDDTARPIPADLVPAVNVLFGTKMSSGEAVASTRVSLRWRAGAGLHHGCEPPLQPGEHQPGPRDRRDGLVSRSPRRRIHSRGGDRA